MQQWKGLESFSCPGWGRRVSQTNLRLLFNTLNPQHSYSKPTLPFARKVTGKMYLFAPCFILYFSFVFQFSSCFSIHAIWSGLVIINPPFGSGLILIRQSSSAQQTKCLFLLQFLSQDNFVELYGFFLRNCFISFFPCNHTLKLDCITNCWFKLIFWVFSQLFLLG